MSSPTGASGSEACRKGHCLATVALSVLVFVHMTHLSQGHLENCEGRPNYSRLEEKAMAEYLCVMKTVERQWESLANTVEVIVFFSKEGKHNP